MARDIRLAAGHISKATIDGSSAYLIRNFTRQTDMQNYLLWHGVEYDPPLHASIRISLANTARRQGYLGAALKFGHMTSGMIDYFLDTFFSNDANESAPVTVKMYTKRGIAVYLQCQMHQPRYNPNNRDVKGYKDVLWPLAGAIDIT